MLGGKEGGGGETERSEYLFMCGCVGGWGKEEEM